ncbi:MAG TPA: S8/S53 family peptidase [Trebonia sp.]|nr:S8/S53 family peptidase [Trebonia sp.]
MDDSVFSSQFQAMRDAFASQGIPIETAYAPNGRVDYIYQAGRLLARADVVPQIREVLPGAVPVRGDEPRPPVESGLVVVSIDDLEDGYLTVPQALDILDERLKVRNPAETEEGGFPLVTPVHILHITQAGPDTVRTCPATEPEVPCCCEPDEPCPPCPPAAADGGAGVVIGICDSGLLADIAPDPWLAGVTGQLDPLGPVLPGGLHDIPRYCGHGTFVAGVARCQAPAATVYVASDFVMSGGEREWVIVQALQQLIASSPAPQVVNLSAGTYARRDWPLLSFIAFESGSVTLTAAAGNDATHRKFWPAAFYWAVGVGALGADQRNRAWFSNYGDWVDVYTLGEGLVNAFATGKYTYKEPPKRPATQVFHGRARWSGTSFAAPLVAGLIAAQMSQAGASAYDATQAVLAQAQAQAISGVGPVLFPR